MLPRRGRLAVAGARPAADALPRLVLLDSAMDVVQIHDSETPRSRSTSPWRAELFQGFDGGFDEVDRIGRAEALGQDVADAAGLAHGADGRAGDHAGAGPGRHEDHLGRAEMPLDRVRNRGPLHVDGEQVAGAVLDGLFHGRRHFVGLAVAPADAALAVADDHQGREAEPPAAFDHRGATPNLDDLVDQLSLDCIG